MTYKVAVLMGGSSLEREFSLASGKRVCDALEALGHEVLPLDTTSDLVTTLRAEKPDVCYIALHGKHGEDGTIQSLLEFLQIPFVGSPATVCRSTWNKSTLPHVLESYREGEPGDAAWPYGICIASDAFKDMGAAFALDLFPERIPAGLPFAVKPASQGSALGMSKVTVDDRHVLGEAILNALSFDDEVIIEEWVDGVELAVSVIGEGWDAYALAPVEIVPRHGIYDTEARLDDMAVDFYAPVRLESLSHDPAQAQAIRNEIERAALEVHRAYGCRDLSRVDMIWDGAQAKVLEINVSPGMTELSLLPMAAQASGIELGQLLEELIGRALDR
ncbi:MAG: D-alanine--D-alanine ligase [Coriobacteriales bacterium]|nr:D-alanine--D-alanine ligase [Coriobacteriales bacterium]